MLATVDEDRRSRYVVAAWRGEKCDCTRYLDRLAHPLDRQRCDGGVERTPVILVERARPNGAGRHAVDEDAVRRPLDGERLGQVDNPGARRGGVRVA